MALLEHYQAMARYNQWMNAKVYEADAGLSDPQRKRDLGAFFGSIHGTLNHLLLADRLWLARLTGDREGFTSRDASGEPIPFRGLDQILYEEFEDLRRERGRTDDHIDEWVAGFDETALFGTLRYKNSKGTEHAHPMWWAVSHFFNHQTHHRGQLTTLLTQLGEDVGMTDLVMMLRDEG